MWSASGEREMFLRVSPSCRKNSLLVGQRDFSKASSLLNVFFFLRSSSITFRFISSLETDHSLKPGWRFSMISRREDLPVEGIVTGIRTITLFGPCSSFIMLSLSSPFYSTFSSTSSSPRSNSAAVELTISMNFSLVTFLSSRRRKSMKRLLTKREMGRDWSWQSSKALLASSVQCSMGRMRLNSLAISAISLLNFFNRLSQPLFNFWIQILSFSLSFRQMRYSIVFTLHTSSVCSPLTSTPLTYTTPPSPPSFIVCSFIATTVCLNFSIVSQYFCVGIVVHLAAGSPQVCRNLYVAEVGRHSSILFSFSTRAQKNNWGCFPQSMRCCMLLELQYSPMRVLLDSSSLMAATSCSDLVASNANQACATRMVSLCQCLFLSLSRSESSATIRLLFLLPITQNLSMKENCAFSPFNFSVLQIIKEEYAGSCSPLNKRLRSPAWNLLLLMCDSFRSKYSGKRSLNFLSPFLATTGSVCLKSIISSKQVSPLRQLMKSQASEYSRLREILWRTNSRP